MIPYKSGACRLRTPFGSRRVSAMEVVFHGGVELIGVGTEKDSGEVVVAVAPGIVIRSRKIDNYEDEDWKFGHYVVVQGDDGVVTYYCHLRSRAVKVGQRVAAGDVLGKQGATGDVDLPCLYVECRQGLTRINAAEYLGIKNHRGLYQDPSDEPEPPVKETPARHLRHGMRVKIVGPDAVLEGGEPISPGIRRRIHTIYRVRGDCCLLRELWIWVPAKFLMRYEKG